MQTRMQLGSTVAAIVKRFMNLGVLALTLAGASAAQAQQAYYIYPDHLNTPRAIENQAMQLVWRWENRDPFGANLPDENPSGLGNFTCNLRLPGQYFDVETAYHYNYFRDYAPETGRYIQSDPIGLWGGLNTYGYVRANPIDDTDPLGLQSSYGFPWRAPPNFTPAINPNTWQGALPPGFLPKQQCGCQVRAPDLVNFQVDYYVGSVWGTFSRSGNSFVGGGLNITRPNPLTLSASAAIGWLSSCDVTPSMVDQFLTGYSGGAAAAYYGIGGGAMLSPDNGSAILFGVGAGVQAGTSYSTTGAATFGYSANRGQTGLGGW